MLDFIVDSLSRRTIQSLIVKNIKALNPNFKVTTTHFGKHHRTADVKSIKVQSTYDLSAGTILPHSEIN